MTFDRLKWTYRAWRYRQRLERQEIRLLLRHLAAGDVAVGAHKGAYTCWMRRAVENLGLSSAAGTLTLNIPGGGPSPGASFEPSRAALPAAQSYPVPLTTLDAYFRGADRSANRSADQRRIRLLKCDAEGHELEVFRSGEGLLTEVRPCLLFECERRHRGSGSVDEVFRRLQEIGYQGFFVAKSGPRDIAEFDPRLHQADHEANGYINNFLFLPAARRGPAA